MTAYQILVSILLLALFIELGRFLRYVRQPIRIYLITSGDGSDGNEWRVERICLTGEVAEREKAAMLQLTWSETDKRKRWSDYDLDIEEWEVLS